MNKCKNYKIPCPFALTEWSELPCFGTQEQCNTWTTRVKNEAPELWAKGIAEREEELTGIIAKAETTK